MNGVLRLDSRSVVSHANKVSYKNSLNGQAYGPKTLENDHIEEDVEIQIRKADSMPKEPRPEDSLSIDLYSKARPSENVSMEQ
jgi:hypothetical protein